MNLGVDAMVKINKIRAPGIHQLFPIPEGCSRMNPARGLRIKGLKGAAAVQTM
jgi:hypothetical protein